MYLSRLIYASRGTDALTAAEFEKILEVSKRNNAKVGVTGVLLFSAREFLQCLEGSREGINQTYARIVRDPRHSDVQILDYREVDRRMFGEWGMHGLSPNTLTRQRLLRFGVREMFSPLRMSAASGLALLQELAEETPVNARMDPSPLPARALASR